jgi:integrase
MALHLTGLRRFELMNLRWRDIDLLEGVLRVVESKSEQGRRSIALPSPLLAALAAHYQRTPFKSEEDFVFAHPRLGSRLEHHWYAGEFRAALKAAGITDYVRPFHDARHSSLTNGAANGEGELKLMTRAGHSSMSTTKEYLHLAGTVFREEAESLADRMLGSVESSTDLSEPDSTLAHLEAGYEAE